MDLETQCAKGCEVACDHALYPHTARITIIGLYWQTDGKPYSNTFNSVEDLERYLEDFGPFRLMGHNLKWDFRMLAYHGFNLKKWIKCWAFDTQLEAATCLEKIPKAWLEKYEAQRQKLNKDLPRGKGHRKAERHSLKTLAPYFLGVDPFWETTTDHNNTTYVLRDCEYTYHLHFILSAKLAEQVLQDFYTQRLMRWAKMILLAEVKGVLLDFPEMDQQCGVAEEVAAQTKILLDKEWQDAYAEYHAGLVRAEEKRIRDMERRALDKLKKPTVDKQKKVIERHQKKIDAISFPKEMNLDSPAQLTWLLRDWRGLDIKTFDEEDESTGKEVLQRLAAAGHADIGLLLQYRSAKKLSTAFFPTYRELATPQGTLHTSFNVAGTRTGRLSSSGPNLQQVPGALHRLFIARSGRSLITRDLNTIEPRLVAYYTQDPTLCALFLGGGDFHSRNAILMFGLPCAEADVKKLYPLERDLAKTVGLALLYGAGPLRIQIAALEAGVVWSEEKCQDIYDNLYAAYHPVFRFKDGLDGRLRAGLAVANLFGRAHYYPNKRDIHMKGFNTLIQSSASDLLLEASLAAWFALMRAGIDAQPLLWVHDEVIFECETERAKEAEEIIEWNLTQLVELDTSLGRIPLKCEGATGPHWSKG